MLPFALGVVSIKRQVKYLSPENEWPGLEQHPLPVTPTSTPHKCTHPRTSSDEILDDLKL